MGTIRSVIFFYLSFSAIWRTEYWEKNDVFYYLYGDLDYTLRMRNFFNETTHWVGKLKRIYLRTGYRTSMYTECVEFVFGICMYV